MNTMDSSVAQPSSSVKGVLWDRRRKKWRAVIKTKGKTKFLGYFDNLDKAKQARFKAEEIYHKPIKDERYAFEAKVCGLYKSGVSMDAIGKLVNKDQSSICDILHKNQCNIRKETQIDLPNLVNNAHTMNIEELSSFYKTSAYFIKRELKKLNICAKPSRKHLFEENCMQNIDHQWKAYFLGLLAADGCIRKDLISLSITLTEADKYVLEYLASFFNGINLSYLKGYTTTNKQTNTNYTSRPSYRLTINSKQMIKDILKYNITPQKSLTLQLPINLSDEMMRHYIRGFFDGDGFICKKGYTVMIVSSNIFCVQLQNLLKIRLNIDSKVVKCGKVSRLLVHRKENILAFKDYLYKDSEFFLKRKYARFPEGLTLNKS